MFCGLNTLGFYLHCVGQYSKIKSELKDPWIPLKQFIDSRMLYTHTLHLISYTGSKINKVTVIYLNQCGHSVSISGIV